MFQSTKISVGDAAAMDAILGSYGIDPEALRADDFEEPDAPDEAEAAE